MGQFCMKLLKERCKNKGLRRNVEGGVTRLALFTPCTPASPPPPSPPSQLSLRAFNIISVGRSVQQMKKQKLDPTLKNFQVLMQRMCKNKNNPEETQQLYIQ